MAQTPECCEEYTRRSGLSRRGFLGGVAAAGGVAVTSRVIGDTVLQAAYGAPPGGNVLVVLSFRGGIDGLGVVVPHADPAYAAARPTLKVPTASLICADAQFGLHPQMQPLQWAWDAGEFAAVNAVGLPVPNRSHFHATEEVEDADPTSSTRRGWVNRMVGLNPSPVAYDVVSLATSIPPGMIEGPAPGVAANRLADISLVAAGNDQWGQRRKTALKRVWGGATGPLAAGWKATLGTVDTIEPIASATYTPAVTYPTAWPGGDLSNALKDAARLIKADIGTQVITVDFGGWDMHGGYGRLEWGAMQSYLGAFAKSMSAFLQDLGDLRSRVTVATISEFGRRLEENGSGGLDHGWGNVMLLFGAGVKGGQYHGTWPGLSHGSKRDDDLKVTTDYRQVLGEIVSKRLDKSVSKVFPGASYPAIGVLN
ncbi:MAG: DUF1501 domain-containing protein [Nocardioidaceae bacterium]|nr:MAG: DUF1501 domain-containing protein [Nocardioidaceae bacterium]